MLSLLDPFSGDTRYSYYRQIGAYPCVTFPVISFHVNLNVVMVLNMSVTTIYDYF